MTTEVTLHNKSSFKIMTIVGQLRDLGYVQKKDFDFSYHPLVVDVEGNETPRYTIFTFHTDSLSSWFAMKYS